MTSIHVPARDLPTPPTISEAAQAVVAATIPPVAGEFPALDDKDGWKRMIAESDARSAEMFGFLAAGELLADTRTIRGHTVYVASPPGSDGDDRVVFDIHGGGLIQMGGELCKRMTEMSATRTRMVTWGVDYRMPPDHPYPTPLDDVLDAYRALIEAVDPSRVVVVGSSAGGNLAAALMLRARDEGTPLPAAVHLGTPEVDLTESGDSFRTNLGVDNILGLLRPANELYADGEDLRHPYLSPLFGDLTGFPPTILTTGTRDLFLSNTVLMHRALRRVGVVAELHVLEAASHGGFFGLAPEDRELFDEVRQFIARFCPPSPAVR